MKIVVQKNENERKIALIENDKLIEFYEDDDNINRNEGNIYIGIIRDIIPGMQAAFVDIGTEKTSFIHLKDILPKIDEKKEKVDTNIDISKIIKVNQKIFVQVKKDSNQKKGARVSTHINLPGKYIVLMPNTNIITVSQKIEDKKEQERLIRLAKENLGEGNGCVIRTLAQGKEQEVIDDIQKVEKKWNDIIQTNVDPDSNEPQLLYKSEDIVEKILIDLGKEKIEEIIVNNKEECIRIKEFIQKNSEYKNIKIDNINKENLFESSEIEKQILKIQNRKVWLNCGGFITIDKTEALTAIDVNTGKYTGSKNLEQTVYKVNEEATVEIAKQLRLRDIGGIVIIDYIDMSKVENRNKIQELLSKEVKKDRSKVQIEGFTKLDLMELTRKHICSHKD